MASEFTYTNPEAAKQAIARLQLQAALAENTSRENIAREQTNAQRSVTQSQISEREKDRAVSREDIASRERSRTGYGSSAAANERANTQYQTVLGEIKASGSDPMTNRELEARLAQFPQITEDLANNLRSERDIAYRAAKNAYDMGEGFAKNYRTELAKKKPIELDAFYKEVAKDKNVTFDRETGTIRSIFPKPREDAPVTMSGLGTTGQSISPAQDYGGAASSSAVPTIGDMKAMITGGIGNAAPIAAAPVVTASDLGPAPARDFVPPLSYNGGIAFTGPRSFRMSDMAPPPAAAIPAPVFAAPRQTNTFNLPQYQSPIGNRDALINMARDPRFPTLPPEHQQMILDEIGNTAQRFYDMQPMQDYAPPPPYYQ